MKEGGRRLVTLIGDLLAYTRAGAPEEGSSSEQASSANAAEVIEQSLANLAEAIRESQGTVTYGKLPEVQMSGSHLQQVFQNLIGNALKYRGDEAPRIHISAVRQGTAWLLSVEDNGI